MQEPVTKLTLEAPGGLVHIHAECKNGKAERITVENVPCFAGVMGATLNVEGIGTLTVDTAYGGDSFVVVDADELGFMLVEDEAHQIARLGVKITNAATEQLGFDHPTNPEWKHISFCLFASALEPSSNGFTAKSIVAIQPGKVDRSPTGTAVSARLALLAAKGEMRVGQELTATSIIGSTFTGKIVSETTVGNKPAIVPSISGRAWITGTYQHSLHPSDPWPQGYRLSDTWGAKGVGPT